MPGMLLEQMPGCPAFRARAGGVPQPAQTPCATAPLPRTRGGQRKRSREAECAPALPAAAGYIIPGAQMRHMWTTDGPATALYPDNPPRLLPGQAGRFAPPGGGLAAGPKRSCAPPRAAAAPREGAGNAKPRVSLIIPVHNAAPTLRESIDSALAQTYGNLEIIVVDDGSTDDSPGIIAGYGGRIRAVRKPHGGLASAMNAGVRAMTGEWYAELDGDDIMYPHAMECLANAAAMMGPSQRVIPASAMRIVSGDGSSRVWFYDCNHMSTFEQGVRHIDHFVGGVSFLVPRAAYDRCGPYDEGLTHEDWEFLLRLVVVHKYRMLHIPVLTYEYRESEGSLSNRDPLQKRLERRRILEAVLAQVPPGQRSRYLGALRRFRLRRQFTEGVYDYANLEHAGSRDAPGGARARLAAAESLVRRHPLLYGAYRSLRRRSLRYALGWAWASRNGGSALVHRCRGQRREEINELTSIGPAGAL